MELKLPVVRKLQLDFERMWLVVFYHREGIFESLRYKIAQPCHIRPL